MIPKVSLLLLLVLLLRDPSAAGQEKVTLRYSLQNEMVRIVLEAERDETVQQARVHSSYTLVRVEFPGDFGLSAPGRTADFEYTKRGRDLYLNIRGMEWIKLLRLKSPPRLVIDAYLKREDVEKPPLLPLTPGGGKPGEAKPGEAKPEAAEEAPPKKPLSRIVLDPGHGGYDLGIYTQRYTEKALVLKVSKSLRYRLAMKGKKVFMTRRADRHKSLMERILYTRKRSPQLVLSLHMSSSDGMAIYTYPLKEVDGGDRYLLAASQAAHTDDSRLIASRIGSAVMEALDVEVFFREMALPVLSYAPAPAILIELPGAEYFDYNAKNIELLVNSIMEGIFAYEKG